MFRYSNLYTETLYCTCHLVTWPASPIMRKTERTICRHTTHTHHAEISPFSQVNGRRPFLLTPQQRWRASKSFCPSWHCQHSPLTWCWPNVSTKCRLLGAACAVVALRYVIRFNLCFMTLFFSLSDLVQSGGVSIRMRQGDRSGKSCDALPRACVLHVAGCACRK